MATEVDTKKSLQQEFERKLEEFIAEDLSDNYKRYIPRRDKALVKVFKFTPDANKHQLGKSSILMVSALDGTLKPSSVTKNEKLFPIVKVIKRGSDAPDWVKEGELYVVPYNDIVGETWNPDFQWMMQNFSQKKGDGKPSLVTIPDDMPQKLLKIDVNWERYKFSMPDHLGDEKDGDKLVYLIPTLKLEADYKL